MGVVRLAWGELLDLLFPRKCPFCGVILDRGEWPVCKTCQRDLPWLTGEQACRKVDFAENCWSPLGYRGMTPNGIHRYKFGRVRACGEPFGVLMTQCVLDQKPVGLDGVTWAPLSRKRLRSRGFDQAELLARAVGRGLDLPVLPLLKKVRHTSAQSHLEGEAARRANALGAYELITDRDLTGRKLLLVDDVVTSGATLSECARLLCQQGARVWCLTLAQARDGSRSPGEPDRGKQV